MDYKEIDGKWQKAWDDARLFEGEISDTKKPYMITVAFPYVNGPQHIGHLRTFGIADVLARYKRMRGYNVLFPMGFHATGTPILAFAKRIKNHDEDLIRDLKLFHIPDYDIEKMTDPLFIADYFVKEIENGMHKAGYSIDWRRKFVSIEPFFSKFVEWQFGLLNSKGYLVKGRHPVGWCPNENNAVGMHDTKRDVEPEIEKVVGVKFRVDGEDAYMMCTTYRPETISGVTNLFINKDLKHVSCKIDGKTYNMTKAASDILKYQMNVEQVADADGGALLAKTCINPMTGLQLPIFSAAFVEDSFGTGVVMSVPAHAPFDYAALEKLKEQGKALDIKPIKVIEIPDDSQSEFSKIRNMPGYLDIPSLVYIDMFKAKGGEDMLGQATKLQYKEESHHGRMTAKGYEGMSTAQARAKITADMVAVGNAMEMYVMANSPVYCRCGYAIVINVVDQWFLNYGDKGWKELAKKAYSEMTVLPEKSRKAFESAIDWIDLRAVARSQGLGTKFPLEPDKIIESLSDSTIYMSFYTVSAMLRAVPVDKLTAELFNYIFLGHGNMDDVSKSTGVDYAVLRRCKESFEYWYTNMSRHSGPDLIFNHLTMLIFNHATIFSYKYWPKQIVVNGSVLSEGEKMSKSLGNIVPLVDALDKYGADVMRTMVAAGAELFSDSEFSSDAAMGLDERFSYLYDIAQRTDDFEGGELRHIDYWLYSKLNRKIRDVTEQIEKLELRGVSTRVVYDSVIELKRYVNRSEPNGMVLKDYITSVVLMMAPTAPHIAEEIWHMLGNESFVSTEKWPTFDESMISDRIEAEEQLLDSIISDAKQLMAMMRKSGKDPKAITLIVAEEWKRQIGNALHKERNIKKVIDMVNGAKPEIDVPDREKAMKYIQQLAKKMNSISYSEPTQDEEFGLLTEAGQYLSESLGIDVTLEKESVSKSQRAQNSAPQRPAIDISM